MTPIPYLFFNGTAEEAIRTYARIFGSPEPQIMRSSEAPEGQAMGESPNSVMHAALKIGDGWLYASDYSKAEPMAGNSIAVTFPTPEKSREIFDALAEGGEVDMPFEATFWSPGFGGLTDRFGTRWMVDTEAPQAGAA
jgi:PhnB protein